MEAAITCLALDGIPLQRAWSFSTQTSARVTAWGDILPWALRGVMIPANPQLGLADIVSGETAAFIFDVADILTLIYIAGEVVASASRLHCGTAVVT